MTAVRTDGRRAPGPRGTDLMRAARQIRTDPRAAFTDLAARYGDVVRLDLPGQPPYFLLNGPEQAQQVLVTRQDRYRKTPNARLLARGLGQGLLANDDDSWPRQRRIVQPLFARRHLDRFAEQMIEATTRALSARAGYEDGRRLDVAEEMNAIVLGVAGQALFGEDLSDRTESVHRAIEDVLEAIGASMRSLLVWWLPARLPGISLDLAMRLQAPRWRRLDQASAVLDDVVRDLIAARKAQTGPASGDLLGLLLEARDDTGAPAMSPGRIHDELKTFLLVGHDTTATALTWTWWLLSENPAHRDRLLAEVDEVLGGREPTAADVGRLTWTTAVVHESMRLFPPSWLIERQCAAGDEIRGYTVPTGAIVSVAPHLLHRDARIWPAPEEFDPHRFLPEQVAARSRYAYLPFGAGRRQCVGIGFATAQATITVAMLSQRLTFDLVPGTQVVGVPSLTLRPHGGMPMVARRRTPDGGPVRREESGR